MALIWLSSVWGVALEFERHLWLSRVLYAAPFGTSGEGGWLAGAARGRGSVIPKNDRVVVV